MSWSMGSNAALSSKRASDVSRSTEVALLFPGLELALPEYGQWGSFPLAESMPGKLYDEE